MSNGLLTADQTSHEFGASRDMPKSVYNTVSQRNLFFNTLRGRDRATARPPVWEADRSNGLAD